LLKLASRERTAVTGLAFLLHSFLHTNNGYGQQKASFAFGVSAIFCCRKNMLCGILRSNRKAALLFCYQNSNCMAANRR
jgi:hypothetical protein